MSEKQLLKEKIHQYDFSIIEAELFLDTHPNCRRALAVLHEMKTERAALVKNYEAKYGAYIVRAADVNDKNRWAWVDSPWPWENSKECEV